MTDILKDLGEPSEFWEYFEQISKIPRCSGHEERVRNYVKQEAEGFGFKTRVDKARNLLVKIPSKIKEEHSIGIVLQCHLDMVCEKNEGIQHDFSKDPLKLKIIEIDNEKWLTAEGTTLGVDNGGGVAYLLTLMKKIYNKELDFSPLNLNFLFTVNEERGLSGVIQIGDDFIDGDYLINLDSEDDDTFTIGCAGGTQTVIDTQFKNEYVTDHVNNVIVLKLNIKGLVGGHSGVDINKNRANSIKLLAKILWKLNNKFSIYINSINGGNLSNAIPRESNSIFFINKKDFSEIMDFTNQIISDLNEEIIENEPEMKVSIKQLNDLTDEKIIPKNIQEKMLHILNVMPNGPVLLHPKIPNLVHTSTNLASIKTKEGLIKIITSQRSIQESSKREISQRIESLFKLAEINVNIAHSVDYPGWEPNISSKLLSISKEVYKELFQKEPNIEIIHAGLETGILKKKFPNFEMISIGPTMKNPHSPDERLKIASIETFWNFLVNLLKNLN